MRGTLTYDALTNGGYKSLHACLDWALKRGSARIRITEVAEDKVVEVRSKLKLGVAVTRREKAELGRKSG